MTDLSGSRVSEIEQPLSRAEAKRYNIKHSCIRCHQRKIRCDKLAPCSTCVKSHNAESCRYPGPQRVKRRSRKDSNTTLVKQVERLEQMVSSTLKQYTDSDRDKTTNRNSSSSSEHKSGDGDLGHGPSNFTGLLIKDGNFVRYVNDHVLSHILEKEEEIRSAIASPYISSSLDSPGHVTRPLSLLHNINQNLQVQDLETLLPTRRRAIQLWQLFVLNVDPIHKLLHIPTAQPIVYAAINNPNDTTPDFRALLFAIYFSALTSTLRDAANISHDEHQPELGQFQHGLEISLSQGAFLDQPTMYSLQAMTMFISAFRCFGSGRSIWTMNGTIIRVAQLMGIHRDGKLFNLSPFDQEMRRRLWWKIITTDSRALEDQGMWTTGNRSLGDAHMPLNIDDRDISPDTTVMPLERTKFTEVTPLLSICHIQVAGEVVSQLSLCADLESYSKNLPAAQEAIARARSELEEKFFCDYNPNIPVQRLFRNGTKMVLDKMEWRTQEGLLRHQLQSESTNSQEERKIYTESDRLFTLACELLDASLELVSNEIYASFTWHSASYLPYELLTFILWRLCTSPNGPSADEAWHIVAKTFSIIAAHSILPNTGPRWAILCKLKEKVARLRVDPQDTAEIMGSLDMDPSHAGAEGNIEEQNDADDMSQAEKLWDPQDLLFSMDWATFQQNLNMDGMMWS